MTGQITTLENLTMQNAAVFSVKDPKVDQFRWRIPRRSYGLALRGGYDSHRGRLRVE